MSVWPRDVIFRSGQAVGPKPVVGSYTAHGGRIVVSGPPPGRGYTYAPSPDWLAREKKTKEARVQIDADKRQGVRSPDHVYEDAGLPIPPKESLLERMLRRTKWF